MRRRKLYSFFSTDEVSVLPVCGAEPSTLIKLMPCVPEKDYDEIQDALTPEITDELYPGSESQGEPYYEEAAYAEEGYEVEDKYIENPETEQKEMSATDILYIVFLILGIVLTAILIYRNLK